MVSPAPHLMFRQRDDQLPGLVRQKLKQRVKRFNVRITARPSMDPALRRQLQLEFASEVKRLSEILQRDLSAWSRP